MTARELITTLEEILEKRNGEDLPVRIDIDFQRMFDLSSVVLLDDLKDDEDHICLGTPRTDNFIELYDKGLWVDEDKAQLN